MRTPQDREGSDRSEERRKRNKLQFRGVHTPRYVIFIDLVIFFKYLYKDGLEIAIKKVINGHIAILCF